MSHDYADKRKYIRLNTVFPIEFQFVDSDKNPTSPLYQGFTRNVAKGGMCIEVKTEKEKDLFKFIPNETKLKLIINIPSSHLATKSFATVKWTKKISEYFFYTYIFGVEYEEIESDNQKMIETHVRWVHRRPKVILTFFLIFLIFIIILMYISTRPLPS